MSSCREYHIYILRIVQKIFLKDIFFMLFRIKENNNCYLRSRKGGLEKPPFLLRKNRSSPGYPISRLRVDIHEDSIDLYCKI